MVLAVRFEAGQTVVRRCIHRNNRIAGVESARVISDDERGLLLWVGEGSTLMRRTTLDGVPVRKMPIAAKLAIPTMLRPTRWRDGGVLILTPPGARYNLMGAFPGGLLRGSEDSEQLPCFLAQSSNTIRRDDSGFGQ